MERAVQKQKRHTVKNQRDKLDQSPSVKFKNSLAPQLYEARKAAPLLFRGEKSCGSPTYFGFKLFKCVIEKFFACVGKTAKNI